MKRVVIAAALSFVAVVCTATPTARPQVNGTALSADAVRALMARVLANQHRNDEALMFYERQEHRITRKQEEKKDSDEDRLFRVVPTGTGTIKITLREQGKPVSEEHLRHQLRYVEQALVWALDPNESKQKQRVQKWQRRAKERHELVEAARGAFTCAWAGRESLGNGAPLVKLNCAPNPAFKPRTRAEEMFPRARATLWVDEHAGQLARVEAELTDDYSIGAGVVGKVYSGGRFVLEQAPVAPGTWLPTRIQFDFRGRRFVFGFEQHETTTMSAYKRIGPPAEALAVVRSDLTPAAPSGSAKP